MLLTLILFITSARGDSSGVQNAVEGEDVQVTFPYPCDSSEVTLQRGNRAPLYNSLSPNSLNLHSDQLGRLKVGHMAEGEKCFLFLSFIPVRRHDEGTYILLSSSHDYITRIWLHVDFFPGKAHCEWNGRHTAGNWEKLYCTAQVGSMPGQIQCYQENRALPPLSTPSETAETLEQTLLALQNKYCVFCCSSTFLEPKELYECNDFLWDPLSLDGTRTEGPCSSITPVQDKTVSPTYPTTKYTSSALPPAATTSEGSGKSREGKPVEWYLSLIAAVIIIITFIVAIIYKCLPWRRLVKNCKNDTQSDEPNTIPKHAKTEGTMTDVSPHPEETTSFMTQRTIPKHAKTESTMTDVSPHPEETTSFMSTRTFPKNAKTESTMADVSPHPEETTPFMTSSDCEGGSNDCGRDIQAGTTCP